MVAGELKRLRWIEEDLAQRRKGVRRETTMTWKWLAQRLNMGTAGSLANLLRNKKAKR